MKLLMISGDRSILAGKRGAFTATLEGLSREFERIDVVTPRSTKCEVQSAKAYGTPCTLPLALGTFPKNVFFYPSPHGLWFQVSWIFHCGKKLIRTHHHDVMTVHEYPPFYNGIGAWLLHCWTRIPYALEVHHVVGWPKAANVTEWIGKMLSRIFLPIEALSARSVRVVNAEVHALLRRWGISEKRLKLVPSFYLDREALTSITERPKQYDVVFASRLVANKGISEILQAMQLLSGKTLLILGDGPERPRREFEASALGVLKRTTFRGWQSTQQEMWSAMTEARVAVMCSTSEGGPRIALEAMAIGMPLVSTKVGIMPTVIRDRENGLFTSGVPEDIAEKIQSLLDDDQKRERMGKSAQSILEHMDGQKLLHGYAAFLKDLAGDHSSAPSVPPAITNRS